MEWLDARDAVPEAERRQRDPSAPSRILLVCGAARHDQTCPGEMSKTFRLVQLAREIVEASAGFECDLLDLSLLTAQYGRQILPCKACVSTAMPLCHWPCSCYPNHAMGQVNDWMNEIYPRWVAAHGVMIVTPVYWYQAPSVLKLMIDRLVCADGGNPDPDHHPRQETGEGQGARAGGLGLSQAPRRPRLRVVVHGDAEGAETLRRRSPTGSWTWSWCRPATAPPSTATSATTSRTPPATTRWTATGGSGGGAQRGPEPSEHGTTDSQQPVRTSGSRVAIAPTQVTKRH